MVNESTMPTPIRIMETVKGRFQFPVLSIRKPPTTGEMIAAKAEPVLTKLVTRVLKRLPSPEGEAG